MARDPVCGMEVEESTGLTAGRDGTTYYFCSGHCRTKFLAGADSEAETTPEDAELWTCPMHPEVRQNHTGDCPKCGMALEPARAGTLADDSELRDMSRRFWVALILTLPVFTLV